MRYLQQQTIHQFVAIRFVNDVAVVRRSKCILLYPVLMCVSSSAVFSYPGMLVRHCVLFMCFPSFPFYNFFCIGALWAPHSFLTHTLTRATHINSCQSLTPACRHLCGLSVCPPHRYVVFSAVLLSIFTFAARQSRKVFIPFRLQNHVPPWLNLSFLLPPS